MVETDKLIKDIKDSRTTLEGLRSYGQMVEEAIKAFDKFESCVQEPTPEKVNEVKELHKILTREIGPYAGYVPIVAHTLSELTEWFETL